MKILLTNDDGVHYAGILEFAKVLRENHEVFMVAPRTEQSGISQAITYLRPVIPIKLGADLESDSHVPGYSLDGTPTDCVKLALFDLCPFRPDLIVSGINGGLNAGVNVCYSGTVGGAMAGALFGYPAMAISLEHEDQMDYARAAVKVVPIIEQLFVNPWPAHTALNINLPTAALSCDVEVCVVPVETNPLGYHFDTGFDPRGRRYYWANNLPAPEPSEFRTDVSVLKDGLISVSPITFNMNATHALSDFNDALGKPASSGQA
jgi:5'-nucleotidase